MTCPRPFLSWCRTVLTTLLMLVGATAFAANSTTLRQPPLDHLLTRLAPGADPVMLRLAAKALSCAAPRADRLAVIDYSLPSSEPRRWVFDLARQRLLFKERVAHGRGSGDLQASLFSNRAESFQSSLGLFRTLESYHGRNGYSLRLEGLEPGINDRAYQRAIVIHGAEHGDAGHGAEGAHHLAEAFPHAQAFAGGQVEKVLGDADAEDDAQGFLSGLGHGF